MIVYFKGLALKLDIYLAVSFSENGLECVLQENTISVFIIVLFN